MIKIRYAGTNKDVRSAVKRVNALFLDYTFYEAVGLHQRFDMADIRPVDLADMMRNAHIEMNVDVYYSMYPFSKALSYFDPEEPMTIWLNKWNIERPVSSLCNTLVHQAIHAVNARYPEYSFGHGDNSCEEKGNTAPFFIAALAQRMIMKQDIACEPMYHEETIPSIPGAAMRRIADSFRSVQLSYC